MAKMSTGVIVGILFGAPILMCGGCLMLGGLLNAVDPDLPKQADAPKAEPAKAIATPVAKPVIQPPKQEMKLSRRQFYPADYLGKVFDTNALKAEKDFNGVQIPVTGVVESVSSDILGTPYVSLQAQNLLGVQCMFPREMSDALTSLQKGQTIFIVGTCQGKTIGIVVVDDCRFVKPID